MVDAVQQLNQGNSLVNQADDLGLPQRITQAIKNAAARTGVDFSYLLNKAAQESSFDPNAKASTSSATGLFQFTNQTWLRTLKDHGGQYGLSQYADHIQVDAAGVAHVSNPAMRQAILNLRTDPQISAEMAGELDKENMESLQANVGGKIGATDLYLAHFLGAGGASDFLNEMKSNPNAKAASVLPDAAASNPSVFYNADGTARSLRQIYRHFAAKFEGSGTAATTAVANASSSYGRVHSRTARTSYTVASADQASATSAALSSYASPMMSGFKAQGSSLFDTMVMAQMNLGDMSPLSAGTIGAGADNHARRNAISMLAGTA